MPSVNLGNVLIIGVAVTLMVIVMDLFDPNREKRN